MKTNKFFATALAVLALVGLTACEQKNQPTEPLTLTETSVTLKVGETHQLVANVAVESWTSSNELVATVANGLVTAVSAGNAIISATAAGVTKTCVVLVEAAGSTGGNTTAAQVKGTKIWPVILDAVTAEANAAKIVGDLRVDDVNNHLYVWPDGTSYNAGEGTGLNFHGNNEGYVALTVANIGWSGLGFCLGDASAAAAEQLRQAIVANPDKYFLHIAMKATTPGNHQFYTFNDAVTSFAVGTATIEAGAVIGDFTRDGSWAEFDVPMANFAAAMANLTFPTGGNIFCALSGNATGSQLNLDAVYFYEK